MKPSSHTSLLPTLVLLCVTFTTLPTPTRALLCWTHYCEDSEWCLQTCPPDEISCLAQFRVDDDGLRESFFGCFETGVPCDPNCEPMPTSTTNSFDCCCSGDLCNSVEGLTPSGDVPTSPPNPEPTPPVSESDGGFVCLSVCLPAYLSVCLSV